MSLYGDTQVRSLQRSIPSVINRQAKSILKRNSIIKIRKKLRKIK